MKQNGSTHQSKLYKHRLFHFKILFQSACSVSTPADAHTHPLTTTATRTLAVCETQLPQQLHLKNQTKSRTHFLICGIQKTAEKCLTDHCKNVELACIGVPKFYPESA